jgi:hypothetical protein
MKEHFRRLWNDLEDLFDRHRASRGRLGWKDIPHAFCNLFVEYCRADAYGAGHWWCYQTLATVVIGIGLLVWSVA